MMIGLYLGPTGYARQKRYLSWINAADDEVKFVVAGDPKFVTAARAARPTVVPVKSLAELASRSATAMYCQGLGDVPASHLKILVGAGVPSIVDGWTGPLPADELRSLSSFVDAGRLLFSSPERIALREILPPTNQSTIASRFTYGGDLDDSLWRALDVSVGTQGDGVLGLRRDPDTRLLVLNYQSHRHLVHHIPSGLQRTELEIWQDGAEKVTLDFENSPLGLPLDLLRETATQPFPKDLVRSSKLVHELMGLASRHEVREKWVTRPARETATESEEASTTSLPKPGSLHTPQASPMFLLVTGAMRTGTTLMGELIYSRAYRRPRHPMVSFSNDELDTLRQVTTQLWRAGGCSPGDPYQPLPLTKAIVGEAYAGWNTRDDPFRRFSAQLSEEVKEIAPARGPIRVTGMKTTHLLTEFDLICRSFREARLIIMTRDPRDTFASHLKRAGVKTEAQTGRILLSILASHQFAIRHAEDPRVKVIKYEDLVGDTERTISDVLRFIGVPEDLYDWDAVWNDEIATNSTFNRTKGRDFRMDVGIAPSIGRYQEHLSQDQISLVETVATNMMADFGYSKQSSQAICDEKFFADLIFPIRASALQAGMSDAPLEHLRLRR